MLDASTVTMDQALQMAEQACAQGQSATALAILTEVLKVDPDQPAALAMLGVLAHQAGQNEQAMELLKLAVAGQPDSAIFRINLAVVHRALRQDAQAIEQYRRALALDPNQTAALNNLGNLLRERGQYHQAMMLFARAVELAPTLSQAMHNLGICHAATGQAAQAVDFYRRALAISPDDTAVGCSLANAQMLLGQLEASQATYRQIIAVHSDCQPAYWGLGITLLKAEQLSDAEQVMRRAVALETQGRIEPMVDLASILRDQGRIEQAVMLLRQAVKLAPNQAMPRQHLASALNYDPEAEPSEVFQTHREYARCVRREAHVDHAQQELLPPPPTPKPADADRRIRLGYLSPDFRGHPVACFMLPIWQNHDPAAVDIYAYAQVAQPDHVTRRCQELFGFHWRCTMGLSDAQLAQMIRADNIDILIDLAGHTADNRLRVLLHRPAPIQMTYMGYPHTTGLQEVDYRLTDAIADPIQSPTEHVETLLRLEPGQSAYHPLSPLPDVSESPALRQGFVTFGSLNNLAKINQPLLKMWAEILARVAHSRLLIVRGGLSGPVRQHLMRPFLDRGISPDRLLLEDNHRRRDAFAQAYHRMDIALDPQPYSGCTSTCEALWMGLPVVAQRGHSHAGRLAASVLAQADLAHWIADTPQQYVALAESLAGNLPALANWRRTLRSRLQASPLCDVVAVTRSLESLCRQVWRTRCGSSKACSTLV